MATEEQSSPGSGIPAHGHRPAGRVSVSHGLPVRCLMPGRPTTPGARQEAVRKALAVLDAQCAQSRKQGMAQAREYIAAGKPPRHATMAAYMEEIRAAAMGPVPEPPTLESCGPDPLAGQDIPRCDDEPALYGSPEPDDFAPWEREVEWDCPPLTGPVPACWGTAEELGPVPAELLTEGHPGSADGRTW